MEDAIRLALFCAFAAGFVGVALRQVRRLRGIHRRYSDPARVARLLVDARPSDPRRVSPDPRRVSSDAWRVSPDACRVSRDDDGPGAR